MNESARRLTDAVEILDRLLGHHPEWQGMVEEERVHAEVAAQIHGLRTSRGLTQKGLAQAVGTTQSVIACLENADYRGHSLRMLRRIASVLDARVVVGFVESERGSG